MAAPKREWFKAAEVCEVAEVQPYMLRSWEAEFPKLGRTPSGGGPRVYRQADIEMVLRKDDGSHNDNLVEMDEPGPPAMRLAGGALGQHAVERVRTVRDGLRDLLRMLSNGEQPDLVLTGAPAKRPAKSKRKAS